MNTNKLQFEAYQPISGYDIEVSQRLTEHRYECID